MPEQTRGKCTFCNNDYTGSGFNRHLEHCEVMEQSLEKLDFPASDIEQTLLRLEIKNAFNKNFWLHLEIDDDTPFQELDEYLRSIWLECCGHLSSFFPGSSEWGNEIPMETPVGDIFNKMHQVTHIYDYGTSTKTLIRLRNVRLGAPFNEKPIFLIGRNKLPEYRCAECGNKAEWLENNADVYFDEYQKALCNEHLNHNSDNEDTVTYKIVNSPRMGVCGYDGPAVSPY